MTLHPTIEELNRWRRGQAGDEQVLEIGRHLAGCSECVTRAAQQPDVNDEALALCDEIDGGNRHPDVERDLFALADGTASREQQARIEWHLATCRPCAETVADLRVLAGQPAARAASRRPLLVAASIAIAILSALLWPRQVAPPMAAVTPVIEHRPVVNAAPPPQPARPAPVAARYARAEWAALVDSVRKGSPIGRKSALRSRDADVLRGDVLRGDVLRGEAAIGAFAPSGVVVKSARPELRWPNEDQSPSMVQIFRGEEEVMRSGALTAARWRPELPLPRGVTYSWQVRVTRGGETQILPAAPTPIAQFHVVDTKTFAELEAAEREHPADALLLGVLHARAGLDAEARTHLERVRDSGDADVARRLLRQLDSTRISQ
jgi:hypothetical protein